MSEERGPRVYYFHRDPERMLEFIQGLKPERVYGVRYQPDMRAWQLVFDDPERTYFDAAPERPGGYLWDELPGQVAG